LKGCDAAFATYVFRIMATHQQRTASRLPYKLQVEDGAAPLHPGEVLREDFLPHYGLSAETLASRIGVARNVVMGLLAEERAITSELAQKLGALFANGAHYWAALQRQYDLWSGNGQAELVRVPVRSIRR
jgi:antitoxin HigA-1